MTMSSSELDQLSRRFVDMWQEQWMHLVTSPETAATMSKMMEMMAPAQQMMGKFFAPETSREQSTAQTQSYAPQHAYSAPAPAAPSSPAAAAPSGAATLAAAFEPVARQLALLAARLDALDERLDTLEEPAPIATPAKKPKSVRKPVARKASPRKPAAGKQAAVKATSARAARKPRAKPVAAKSKRSGTKPQPRGRGKSR